MKPRILQTSEALKVDVLLNQMRRLQTDFSDLMYQVEDLNSSSSVTPMHDALYIASVNVDEKVKIGEWKDFWSVFFANYEDECLPVMEQLRDELNANIKSIKEESKYKPITIGGTYRE